MTLNTLRSLRARSADIPNEPALQRKTSEIGSHRIQVKWGKWWASKLDFYLKLWCDISMNCALNTFTPPKHILWQIQTIMGHSNGTERAFMMTMMQLWLKRLTCAHSWSKVPRRRTQRWRCSQTDWKQTGGRQQCQERTSAYLSQKALLTQKYLSSILEEQVLVEREKYICRVLLHGWRSIEPQFHYLSNLSSFSNNWYNMSSQNIDTDVLFYHITH